MRPTLAGVLALCALAAACGGATPGHGPRSPTRTTPQAAVSSPPPCSDQVSPSGFTLSMVDDRFQPDCLTVSGASRFRLSNQGSVRHNFSIAGTGVSVDVGPGHRVSEAPLQRSGVTPGTYRFFCRFHQSRGMTGTIHVLAA